MINLSTLALMGLLAQAPVPVQTRPAGWIDVVATSAGFTVARLDQDRLVVEGQCEASWPNARFLRAASNKDAVALVAAIGSNEGPDRASFRLACSVPADLGPVSGQNPVAIEAASDGWTIYAQRTPFTYDVLRVNAIGTVTGQTRQDFGIPDGTSQGFLDPGIITDTARVAVISGRQIILPSREDRLIAGQWPNNQIGACIDQACFNLFPFGFETHTAQNGGAYAVVSRGLASSWVAVIEPPYPPDDPSAGREVSPPPPLGQLSIVQEERAKFGTPLTNDQLSLLLTRIVRRLGPDWGLLRKPGGRNCPYPGGPISCDVIVRRSSPLEAFDVLADSEGEARPVWSRLEPINEVDRFVAPSEPGPDPDPGPPPPPNSGPDLSPIIARLAAIEAALVEVVKRLDQLAARPDTPPDLTPLIDLICAERPIEVGIRILGTAQGRIKPCKER